MKRKPRVIILQHNGGQLANQLWNHISLFAYARYKGYEFRNYSFFEYAKYFSIRSHNPLIDLLFFVGFQFGEKFLSFQYAKKIWRKLYKVIVKLTKWRFQKQIIYSRTTKDHLGTYFLPPTTPPTPELELLEQQHNDSYFDGWLFRNPKGIIDYRKEILKELEPSVPIQRDVERIISNLRSNHRTIIGVHLRQGDYEGWKGDRFTITQQRARNIIDEYVQEFRVDLKQTVFLLCTNGNIDTQVFEGLPVYPSMNTFIVDLFSLAACDTIIGSDSTFGSLASYIGDIPHVVFTKEPIDWNYYHAHSLGYFENKYCLTVCSDPTLWNGF